MAEYKSDPVRVLYLNRNFDPVKNPVFRTFTAGFRSIAMRGDKPEVQLKYILSSARTKNIGIPKKYKKIFDYYNVETTDGDFVDQEEFSSELIDFKQETTLSKNFNRMNEDVLRKEKDPFDTKVMNVALQNAVESEEQNEEKEDLQKQKEEELIALSTGDPIMVKTTGIVEEEEFTPATAKNFEEEILSVEKDESMSEPQDFPGPVYGGSVAGDSGFSLPENMRKQQEIYDALVELVGADIFTREGETTEQYNARLDEIAKYFEANIAQGGDVVEAIKAQFGPLDQEGRKNLLNNILQKNIEDPTKPLVPFAANAPEFEHPPKYHKYSVKIYLGSDTRPNYDPELEKNIYSSNLSKEEIIDNINRIIVKYGSDLFISGSRKSDTLDELHELTQLQFCLMRHLATGPRFASANISIKQLSSIYNQMQPAQNVPVQQPPAGPDPFVEAATMNNPQNAPQQPQKPQQPQQTGQSIQVQMTPNEAFEKIVEEFRNSPFTNQGRPRFDYDLIKSTLLPSARTLKGPNSMIDPANNYIIPVKLKTEPRTVNLI